MKLENRTPAGDGFYMPGEFEPQDGVLLIWPKRPGSWPYEAKAAGKVFAEIANKLVQTENVYMLVEQDTEAIAKELTAQKGGTLTIKKGVIVTPSAKDIFSREKMELVWETGR